MMMMMTSIESCDKAMLVIQWNWIINTFWQLMEIFREVYFLPIIVRWCYAESPSANSDLTQIESFFNAYFPLNTVDRIRKIDIIVYHWNGQYLNIQCTAHLLLSSHFRLFCSFVLFRKAKRGIYDQQFDIVSIYSLRPI